MYEHEIGKLAAEIRRRVVEYKRANPNANRRLIRVRRPDFTLIHQGELYVHGFQPERIEEDIWDSQDAESFLESVVKALVEYSSLESVLDANTRFVEQFARALCFASFEGLNDGELDARVNAFGCEVEGKPLPVTVTAYIGGLSLGESPLTVSERLLFRRPTPEDVAEYVELDEHGGFSMPLDTVSFFTVGEFIFDAAFAGTAQKEFLRTLEALRLFRVGGIVANRYTVRSRHSFLGGIITVNGRGRYSRYNYSLAASESTALKAFLRDIAPLLPDSFQSNKPRLHAEIAYARYQEALFQGGLAEQEITPVMTALEALFLTGGSELTHRLAQRVSVFLRVLGTQPDAASTYDNIVKGYKIRSKFIHGESLKPDHRAMADSLAKVLLQYVRECVVGFFQISVTKADLLQHLDRSMIDPGAIRDLTASVATVVHK